MTRDFEDVYDELSRMSADDIHNLLKVKGIRGYRASGRYCPIANYLMQECGLSNVHVGTKIVPNFHTFNDIYGPRACPTPSGVKRFIEDFDGGFGYQDLQEGA